MGSACGLCLGDLGFNISAQRPVVLTEHFFCDFSYSPRAYSGVAPNLNCSEHHHCVVPYDGELRELLRHNNHPSS